jgi:cell division protein FtsW
VPKRRSFDPWLLLTVAMLAIAGLFHGRERLHYIAMSVRKDPTYFLVRHGAFLAVGLAAMAGTMAVPLHRLDQRRVVGTIFAVTLGLLLLVLAMPAAGGAHRWFRLGPFGFQPSELAKIATVLLLAYMLSRRTVDQVNDLRSTLGPTAVFIGTMVFLIVIEPDLGSAVMVLASAVVMLFVAGLRFRYLGAVAAIGIAFVVVAILAQPYRMGADQDVLRPESDPQGAGFQLAQSRLAVGSGGLTGVGFGMGQQKAFFLPAPHTDFIFSVVGEEFGCSARSRSDRRRLSSHGAAARDGGRPESIRVLRCAGRHDADRLAIAHSHGRVRGLLPTKGLPFPLLSYGGSSLIASFAVIGLILNVSQHSN